MPIISRVEALNYRCLSYISQPLRPFQILVGANATGKSAFLDVISLLGDFLKVGLDDAILMRERPAYSPGRASRVSELIFNQIADHFELAIEVNVPASVHGVSCGFKRARYIISLGQNVNTKELFIRGETLWLSAEEHVKGQMARQITLFPAEPEAPNSLTEVRESRSGGWRKIVNKTETGNDYFQAESGKWNNMFRVGPRKAALANLPEDIERFPVSIWVRNLLMEGIHVLALNSAIMRRPCSPSLPRSFRVDGSNLPIVIKDLYEKHKSTFLEWLNHVRTILTDVKSISVKTRPEDRHLYLAIQYYSGGEAVPSWLLSDGTLRFLALTLLAYLPGQNGIFLIEEPENGIHPKAVEAVYQSLSSVYDGQVLLATHSPLLLRLAKVDQILCFAKNPSGATDIVSGDEHPRLRDWKGATDIATLYASGVLG
jgi:predicted ATPase